VADIARRYGATRWQIYDWRRRFRRGLLSAPKEDVASPAFVPLSVDDDLQRTPHAEIVEVAIGDIELTRASVSTWRKRHEYDCLRAWTPLLLQKKTPP
jgi:transposase-like protein